MVRQYFTPQYNHPSSKFTDSAISKEFMAFLLELDCGVNHGVDHARQFDAGVWINMVQYEMGFGQ